MAGHLGPLKQRQSPPRAPSALPHQPGKIHKLAATRQPPVQNQEQDKKNRQQRVTRRWPFGRLLKNCAGRRAVRVKPRALELPVQCPAAPLLSALGFPAQSRFDELKAPEALPQEGVSSNGAIALSEDTPSDGRLTDSSIQNNFRSTEFCGSIARHEHDGAETGSAAHGHRKKIIPNAAPPTNTTSCIHGCGMRSKAAKAPTAMPARVFKDKVFRSMSSIAWQRRWR